MNLKREMLMIIIPFLFTLLFIPCVKKIAEFIGAMDLPNERKVHKVPIARLGGLGIYGGFLIGYMIFGQQSIQMNAILIGSFIIIITGIIDDIRPVPAKYKLLGQLAGAAVIPFYGKIILQDVSAFGIYLDFGFFAPVITMIFITAWPCLPRGISAWPPASATIQKASPKKTCCKRPTAMWSRCWIISRNTWAWIW